MAKPKQLLPGPGIERAIRQVRDERVILDSDLAKIYGVETRVLKQAVRRNRAKFPPDFLFELTLAEATSLRGNDPVDGKRSRSQIVTLKRGANVKHRPFAFTEHGAIMAANILNSPQAVQMSVFVVRAFVRVALTTRVSWRANSPRSRPSSRDASTRTSRRSSTCCNASWRCSSRRPPRPNRRAARWAFIRR